MLTINKQNLDCQTFRVKGGYGSTIARLFSLPLAVENKEPLSLDITLKGDDFKPVFFQAKVFWNRKFIGYFVIASISQEWDGDRYKTRLELKQCDRPEKPQPEDIPLYKWRHDLLALSQSLPQTDGAKIEAGREFDPFANSWKK
jgi:hypothetical protein